MITRESASPELLKKYEALTALKSKAWGSITSQHAYEFLEINREFDELAKRLAGTAGISQVMSRDELESLTICTRGLLELWIAFFAAKHSSPEEQSLNLGNIVEVLSYAAIEARNDLKSKFDWEGISQPEFQIFFGFDYEKFLSEFVRTGPISGPDLNMRLFRFLIKETQREYPYLTYASTGERISFRALAENYQYRKSRSNYLYLGRDLIKEEEINPENHDVLKIAALKQIAEQLVFSLQNAQGGTAKWSERLVIDWHSLYLRAKNEYTLHRLEVQHNICLWLIVSDYYKLLKGKKLSFLEAAHLVKQAIKKQKELLEIVKTRLKRLRELNTPDQILKQQQDLVELRSYIWLALRQCKPFLIEKLMEIAPEL